jgi:hypothetical protein
MLTPQQDLEQEIERLVRELGQIVRSADPESKTISKSSPQPLWIKSLFLREEVHASPNVKNP